MWFHHMFFLLMYSGDTQNTGFGLYPHMDMPLSKLSVGQFISEWYCNSMGTQIQQLTSYPVLHT